MSMSHRVFMFQTSCFFALVYFLLFYIRTDLCHLLGCGGRPGCVITGSDADTVLLSVLQAGRHFRRKHTLKSFSSSSLPEVSRAFSFKNMFVGHESLCVCREVKQKELHPPGTDPGGGPGQDLVEVWTRREAGNITTKYYFIKRQYRRMFEQTLRGRVDAPLPSASFSSDGCTASY